MEEWEPIDEWYAVSDQGRVYSWKRRGRYLSLAVDDKGYMKVKKPGNRRVHRLVLEAFRGPCPEGRECDHVNEDKTDNRLENLRWLSIGENRRRSRLGCRHPLSKVTEDQVHWIRASRLPGVVISEWLGISDGSVSRIRRGKSHNSVREETYDCG